MRCSRAAAAAAARRAASDARPPAEIDRWLAKQPDDGCKKVLKPYFIEICESFGDLASIDSVAANQAKVYAVTETMTDNLGRLLDSADNLDPLVRARRLLPAALCRPRSAGRAPRRAAPLPAPDPLPAPGCSWTRPRT